MRKPNSNILTFSTLGIAAYLMADTIHEVAGHSLWCLIIGQNIRLVGSVYFLSSPGSFITDLAGPLTNLVAAILFYLLLSKKKTLSLISIFLFLITIAYNLFWFSGTILQSSFSTRGDWTYFISQMNIGSFGKPILIVAGIAAYYFSIRFVSKQIQIFSSKFFEFPLKSAIHYSYIAATVAAMIAGLFFAPDRINASKEGMLEMIGSIPVLFIKTNKQPETSDFKLKKNTTLNLIICGVFVLFCLTLGHGIFLK
jgi:hypothetical protein